VVVLLAPCLVACGVPLQEHPADLRISSSPEQTIRPSDGGFPVTVYLLRDGRLEPVQRSTDDASLDALVALLAQGPTEAEVDRGLGSALSAQQLGADQSIDTRVITITATEDFTNIAGDDQLLAVAQLVWTVTEYQPTARVRMAVDGEYIDLPSDQGLTRRPTSRADYSSVAPEPATEPSAVS